MAELHLDIHEEILARSQVDDLIRFKCVCKSWNSLISSPRFIKSHLNYNSKKKADNNEIGDTRIHIVKGYPHSYGLVGSYNGLVCMYVRDCDDFLYVVNPSTCEVNELTLPQDIHIQVFGFGYDSSIDDFKVVVGFYDYKISDDKVHFKVLTLKSNVWRLVDGEVVGWPLYTNANTYGTLCNGVIHWLFNGEVIVTFDLSKEVIIEIPIPVPPLDRFRDSTIQGIRLQGYNYTLGTIKDRLCIKYQKWRVKKTEKPEIWVTRNYKVMKTEGIEMERWLPLPGYDEHDVDVSVHSLECPGQDSLLKLSTISECNYNFDLPVFVKSLVSPHGMGETDSGNGTDSKAVGPVRPLTILSPIQTLDSS